MTYVSVPQKIIMNKALTDPVFATEVFSKLPLDAFEDDTQKQLAQEIKRYYITTNKPVNEETFLARIGTRLEEGMGQEEAQKVVGLVREVYDVTANVDVDVATETAEKHIRKALTVDTLKNFISEDKLDEGEAIENLSKDLIEIALLDIDNSGEDNFIDVLGDTDKKIQLYKTLKRETYPTGFSNIDGMLEGGGMAKGEVGLIIAQTGAGKSSFAIQSATNAVNLGLNVLYISLEENLGRLTSRMEGNLLGISFGEFFDHEGNLNEEFVRATGRVYEGRDGLGNLYVSKHNPQEVTIEKLEQIIMHTKIRRGIDIDYVAIDYPALMKTPYKSASDSDAGGELFERIRGLAQKYNFIAMTLAQTNRTAWSADRITLENIEGSKKVANACELILTLNRTQEEYENQYLRLHVDKVRNPKPGSILPDELYFNIDLDGYVIQANTQAETDEHKRILNSTSRVDEEASFDKATSTVNNINSLI